MNIQWYPGHMTKAKRMMQENIKLIDCVVELLDARIPLSSQNPDLVKIANGKPRVVLLTKMDLADPKATQAWVEYFKKQGALAMPINARDGQNMNKVTALVQEACKERIERNKRRGLINRPLRLMVAGIPNVGKSTFINKLVGRASTKTGNKPGVTKGKQWIKLKKGLELLDTPGILWPKFDDDEVGLHLAFIGSINDTILDVSTLCIELIKDLMETYPDILVKGFSEVPLPNECNTAKIHQWLLDMAVARHYLKDAGQGDLDRMAKLIIEDYRSGKLGRMTLDKIK